MIFHHGVFFFSSLNRIRETFGPLLSLLSASPPPFNGSNEADGSLFLSSSPPSDLHRHASLRAAKLRANLWHRNLHHSLSSNPPSRFFCPLPSPIFNCYLRLDCPRVERGHKRPWLPNQEEQNKLIIRYGLLLWLSFSLSL